MGHLLRTPIPDEGFGAQLKGLLRTRVGQDKNSAFGAILGSLGDLRRATSGERETEPKQIGEGIQDGTIARKNSDFV